MSKTLLLLILEHIHFIQVQQVMRHHRSAQMDFFLQDLSHAHPSSFETKVQTLEQNKASSLRVAVSPRQLRTLIMV